MALRPDKPPSNPRRTNGTKRNKVRARVLREETHCWLCGQPVDVKLAHGLPQSPEVDEIIPVSKGGDPYDRRNCRLAHRLCIATNDEATKTQTKSDTTNRSRPHGNGDNGKDIESAAVNRSLTRDYMKD